MTFSVVSAGVCLALCAGHSVPAMTCAELREAEHLSAGARPDGTGEVDAVYFHKSRALSFQMTVCEKVRGGGEY